MLERACADRDWAGLRDAAEQAIGRSVRPTARDYLALTTACRNLGDLRAAANAAHRAWECAPDLPEMVLISARAAAEQGDGELALLRYRVLADRYPENPRWAFEIVRLLEMLGRVGEAVSQLNAALRYLPADPLLWLIAVDSGFRTLEEAAGAGVPAGGLEFHTRLAARAPADKQLLRPVMSEEKTRDVIVAPAIPGALLVVVFTGTNDTLGLPLPVFDRYLAHLGVNAVYLKDFERLLYLRGVRSLGGGQATLTALRRLQRQIGSPRLCTIGTSDGGFAAIRYGVWLGAERIIGFGAPTHRAPHLDAFAVLQRRHAAQLPERNVDLRVFLGSRRHSSCIALHYGEQMPRDRVHAVHLAGLDGVTLHPISELNDHQCLRWYALNRNLKGLLGEWLDV
jgi:tetratricopeptide (TPR) repeat protein